MFHIWNMHEWNILPIVHNPASQPSVTTHSERPETVMATSWHVAGTLSDIADDQPLSTRIGDREVGVYVVDGKFYALEDVCPHAYALISQGFVEGEEIECPLHGAKFHIPTGRCTREPAGRDLKCYPVKVEGDTVLVGID